MKRPNEINKSDGKSLSGEILKSRIPATRPRKDPPSKSKKEKPRDVLSDLENEIIYGIGMFKNNNSKGIKRKLIDTAALDQDFVLKINELRGKKDDEGFKASKPAKRIRQTISDDNIKTQKNCAKKILAELVYKRRAVLEPCKFRKVKREEKRLAWNSLAMEYNCMVQGDFKTIADLKIMYANMKASAKAKFEKFRDGVKGNKTSSELLKSYSATEKTIFLLLSDSLDLCNQKTDDKEYSESKMKETTENFQRLDKSNESLEENIEEDIEYLIEKIKEKNLEHEGEKMSKKHFEEKKEDDLMENIEKDLEDLFCGKSGNSLKDNELADKNKFAKGCEQISENLHEFRLSSSKNDEPTKDTQIVTENYEKSLKEKLERLKNYLAENGENAASSKKSNDENRLNDSSEISEKHEEIIEENSENPVKPFPKTNCEKNLKDKLENNFGMNLKELYKLYKATEDPKSFEKGDEGNGTIEKIEEKVDKATESLEKVSRNETKRESLEDKEKSSSEHQKIDKETNFQENLEGHSEKDDAGVSEEEKRFVMDLQECLEIVDDEFLKNEKQIAKNTEKNLQKIQPSQVISVKAAEANLRNDEENMGENNLEKHPEGEENFKKRHEPGNIRESSEKKGFQNNKEVLRSIETENSEQFDKNLKYKLEKEHGLNVLDLYKIYKLCSEKSQEDLKEKSTNKSDDEKLTLIHKTSSGQKGGASEKKISVVTISDSENSDESPDVPCSDVMGATTSAKTGTGQQKKSQRKEFQKNPKKNDKEKNTRNFVQEIGKHFLQNCIQDQRVSKKSVQQPDVKNSQRCHKEGDQKETKGKHNEETESSVNRKEIFKISQNNSAVSQKNTRKHVEEESDKIRKIKKKDIDEETVHDGERPCDDEKQTFEGLIFKAFNVFKESNAGKNSDKNLNNDEGNLGENFKEMEKIYGTDLRKELYRIYLKNFCQKQTERFGDDKKKYSGKVFGKNSDENSSAGKQIYNERLIRFLEWSKSTEYINNLERLNIKRQQKSSTSDTCDQQPNDVSSAEPITATQADEKEEKLEDLMIMEVSKNEDSEFVSAEPITATSADEKEKRLEDLMEISENEDSESDDSPEIRTGALWKIMQAYRGLSPLPSAAAENDEENVNISSMKIPEAKDKDSNVLPDVPESDTKRTSPILISETTLTERSGTQGSSHQTLRIDYSGSLNSCTTLGTNPTPMDTKSTSNASADTFRAGAANVIDQTQTARQVSPNSDSSTSVHLTNHSPAIPQVQPQADAKPTMSATIFRQAPDVGGLGWQLVKKTEEFVCHFCKVNCITLKSYNRHLEGKKHQKKKAEEETRKRGIPNHLICKLCNVTCTGKVAYDSHIRGAKHQRVLKLRSMIMKTSC